VFRKAFNMLFWYMQLQERMRKKRDTRDAVSARAKHAEEQISALRAQRSNANSILARKQADLEHFESASDSHCGHPAVLRRRLCFLAAG
jgi:uncharacterized coiled-coil DUF342 family protein